MRIVLSVSDQAWGGKHRYMFDVVRGLRAAGHAVHVVVESGGRMAKALHAAEIPATEVTSFAEDPASAIDAVRAIVPDAHVVCATGRHDAAVLHEATSPAPENLMVMLFRHSAYPLEVHGSARAFLHRADLVIATSHEQAERQFGEESVPYGSVEVIHSGMDRRFLDEVGAIDHAAARSALGLDPGRCTFAVLARLSHEKGVDRVLRALTEVDADLVIAGEGPLREELEDLAAELGVAGRVTFLGHVDDVGPVIAASNAVVLASTVPETGPLALKEAMGAGKPVIASRVGGIPEIVTDRVDGLLVDDDEGLVAAMGELTADRGLAEAMGANARRTIRTAHMLDGKLRHLLFALDLQALKTLPLETTLPELSWGKVQWRAEADTGFVFVPRTSEISELPMRTYEHVKRALEAGSPTALADDGLVSPEDAAELLFRMGALVRVAPGPVG